ncbi:MAG: DUF3560 domain-containing protein [Capsulimonas sp.]|uniref:DUF3560 domain-containing protein n=1 Tax=Capsulimonas sp. TaxID=2494211 RepID=UPI0032632BF6
MNLTGMTVTEEQTTPSRPGKKPRAVWVVRGAMAARELMLKGLGGRKYNGAWSFWEDPTDAIAEALEIEDGREDAAEVGYGDVYEQQQEELRQRRLNRAERLEGWAESRTRQSDAHYRTVRRIGDMIPFGQPILVGHHSEERARRDAARMDSNMRRSVESSNMAADHSEKAANLRRLAEDAPKSPTYINNRIEEARTEIGKLERALQGKSYVHSEPRQISDKACQHYSALLAEQRGKLEYWQKQLAAVGGDQYSRENVKPGDSVKIRGSWEKIVRANAKTVSVETGYSWTMKYFYAEIQDHKQAELQTAAPAAKEGSAQ